MVGVALAVRGLCVGSVRGGLVTKVWGSGFFDRVCVVVGALVRIELVVGGSFDGSSLSSSTCSSASCNEIINYKQQCNNQP